MREKNQRWQCEFMLQQCTLYHLTTSIAVFLGSNFVKNQADFYYLYILHLYLKHMNKVGYK